MLPLMNVRAVISDWLLGKMWAYLSVGSSLYILRRKLTGEHTVSYARANCGGANHFFIYMTYIFHENACKFLHVHMCSSFHADADLFSNLRHVNFYFCWQRGLWRRDEPIFFPSILSSRSNESSSSWKMS